MCGRYSLASEADEVVEAFDVPPLAFEHHPRYNIAPGQDAPVLARDRRGRRIGLLRWGLVPSWSERGGTGFINARGESVGDTPSFRDAFLHRRCLVPADGFYEWRADAGGKTPFYFQPTAERLISFAGIWERWARPGYEPRYSFAILTVGASRDVAPVHRRMPVVVAPSQRWTWLDPDTPLDRVHALVAPAPAGSFVAHAVSTRVNSASVDEPSLVEAVE